jgi:hypothetical protein
MVVGKVAGQDATKVSLAEDKHVIQALASDRPMSRSAKGFCHGPCGAERTSSISMPFKRCQLAARKRGRGRG